MAERLSELTERMRAPAKADFLAAVFAKARSAAFGTDVLDEVRALRNPRLDTHVKANVSGGGIGSGQALADLFSFSSLAPAWIQLLSQKTVRGRLQTVPINFRQRTIVDTSTGTADFVAEGAAIPLQALDLEATAIATPMRLGTIVAFSNESLQLWNPTTQANIERRLTLAVARGEDSRFLDPDSAAVAGERPASVLSGVSPLGSVANTAASALAGIEAILAALVDGGSDLAQAAIAMHPHTALTLSLMQNSNGNATFPALTATGGSISGVPVLTSVGCVRTSSPNERFIAALDGARIVTADEGRVEIAASRLASLEMDSAPSGDSLGPTAANVVNLYQTESTAIRVTRYADWKRAHSSAVAWVTSAV